MHRLLEQQVSEAGLKSATLPGGVAALLRAVDESYRHADRERERAAAEARHAEKLALVASRTDNAVIITDIHGNIEWVNEGFTRVSGYTLEEVTGRKPGAFLQGLETDPLTVEFMREQLARGEGFKTEVINYSKDGRKYWLSIEVQPIYDAAGELRYFMAIESDISARKEVELELQQAKEQAEAASKAKSEFLANMSHEIRTPLNGVIGMTELLLGSDLTSQQRRFVEIAKSSADSLLVVINQILDFSKIEAGKLELETIDFDLRAVLEEVCEMMAQRASGKGLELACHIDSAIPTSLRGDPSRLRQVLVNLVNNAVKFTAKGEVIVHVAPEAMESDRATLRFAVTDSGVGIPGERLDRLFRAFSQVDASTTRRFGGTGLGLAICKQIVELMGGEIGVESKEGRGSTFWFTASLSSRRGELLPSATSSLADIGVLAADDNPAFLQILCGQLEGWGMWVAQATSAGEAMDRLRQSKPRPIQIAIIDMGMPGTTGLELVRMIRAEHNLRSLPMLLLTSLDHPVKPEDARAAGACDTVAKPVRQSQLLDAIQRAAAIARGETPPMSVSAMATTGTHRAARQARILLAEDNEVNQIVAAETLTKAGFDCDIVADGRQAVEATGTNAYDAVLMDCQMPEMDGMQATAAIRKREADSGAQGKPVRPLPIIALTANALNGDREMCLRAGMDEYLSKPLNPRELISTLNRLVAGRDLAPSGNAPAPLGGSAPDPESSFNLAQLLERCMGDIEFRDRLLARFPEQAVSAMRRIAEALASGNAQQVTRAAHGLKGTAANLSASRVLGIASEIEVLGKADRLAQIDPLLSSLQAELDRCAATVREVTRAPTGKDHKKAGK